MRPSRIVVGEVRQGECLDLSQNALDVWRPRPRSLAWACGQGRLGPRVHGGKGVDDGVITA
jgi:hypothetical protein